MSIYIWQQHCNTASAVCINWLSVCVHFWWHARRTGYCDDGDCSVEIRARWWEVCAGHYVWCGENNTSVGPPTCIAQKTQVIIRPEKISVTGGNRTRGLQPDVLSTHCIIFAERTPNVPTPWRMQTRVSCLRSKFVRILYAIKHFMRGSFPFFGGEAGKSVERAKKSRGRNKGLAGFLLNVKNYASVFIKSELCTR